MVGMPRLEQRLGQALVMTPQLQQAIKLLQYSNLQLTAFVDEELERNPLLEAVEDEPVRVDEPTADAPFESDAPGDDPQPPPDSAELTASDRLASDAEAPLDADYANVYDTEPMAMPAVGSSDWGRGGGGNFDDAGSLEDTLTRPKGLRQQLEEQLGADIADPVDRMICLGFVDLIDDSGYLDADLEAVAERLGCPLARVEAALALAQRCEPAGVFARSLGECLRLQLADRDRLSPAMAVLVDNLELVADRALSRLAALCAVEPDEMVAMVRELRTLDPKPGLAFVNEIVQTVVADVMVRRRADGGWAVELNSDTLPRVLVNNRYYAVVARATRDKGERAFLSDSLQTANWLVKALDQRANTILKVATEIVRQQDGFLVRGVQHLRPLTLRDVAEEVEMHESTVSRVTSNKYMATPRGIYELKYFFTSAIPGRGGAAPVSSEAVRHRIRVLIDREGTDSVLSDDRLVTLLRSGGIDIARRTVAKYRESMRIPSSVQRRRQKSASI